MASFSPHLSAAHCLLLATFLGCGPSGLWTAALSYEKQGARPKAIQAFSKFIERYPQDPRAPEGLYRLGANFRELHRFEEARAAFERVVREFAKISPWAVLSREAVFNCPDYFPLQDGFSWVEVDSQTGGQHLRTEIACQQVSGSSQKFFKVTKEIYAGKKWVRRVRKGYRKWNWQLQEAVPGKKGYAVILQFPFSKGYSWNTMREGQSMRFEVVDNRATVQVKAGTFHDCLKVKEIILSHSESWKYDYYAPGVGKVLTSIGGPGFEHRNTELLSLNGARRTSHVEH